MWTTDTEAAGSPPLVGVTPRRRLSLAGDERLARLIKDGSEEAFAALYERYYQRLYRYCRSMLRNGADAEDALQSTFAGAYVALAEGRRDAPMRPWLYRIAYNESVSTLRRRRPEAPLVEANELAGVSVEERTSERARLALLVADLGELAERQRGALVMRELSGLSHEEIAVALGVGVGAAKQTIFEARQSLAEFAQGRAMACEDICRAVSDGNGRALRGRKIRAHLRDCAACTAFEDAIPARSRDLRAIAPPLSTFAAASLLRRALGAGSTHGTSGGAGVAAGAAGKTAAVALTAKAVASVAVVATAAVGVTGVVRSIEHSQSHATIAAQRSHAPRSAASRASNAGARSDAAARVERHATNRAADALASANHSSRARGHARGREAHVASPAIQTRVARGHATTKLPAPLKQQVAANHSASPQARSVAGSHVKPVARSGSQTTRTTTSHSTAVKRLTHDVKHPAATAPAGTTKRSQTSSNRS